MTPPETASGTDGKTQPDRHSPREALALLAQAAAPERRGLAKGLGWLVVAAALEAIGPILGKHFIDAHVLPRDFSLGPMALLLGAMLLAGWAASLLRYAQLRRMAAVAQRSVLRLREQVYAHVLAQPMAFFDRSITGQLLSRITNDTDAVNNLYRQVLFVMLDSTIVVAGALVAMAWLDWRLMLIVLALVPASSGIIWLYQRASSGPVQKARALRAELNAQMAESMAGMAMLQSAGAAQRFAARYETANQAQLQARVQELRANAWLLRPALDLLNVLLIVTVIYGFGQRELSGMEVGLLYAFLAYIARVVEPLIQITMQFSQLQQALVAASRVRALLREPSEPRSHRPDLVVGAGAIRFEHLHFAYTPEQPVLRDLDLDIPAGSFVGIAGHTGSGKSTLLALLLRFYQPQQGRILIDGQPLAQLPDETFHEALGLVPQEPYLIAGSVRDNIRMGRAIPDEQLEAAARAARAHDFLSALPQAYDSRLGDGGLAVSTGQKQLIALARALAGNPRILLLDEATANIDSATEAQVGEALRALRGRVTVIAIAHRLSTIRDADQIVVLNHGRLSERGTHEALMAIEGGIYQRLVQLQALEE
ncbi:ATP-binding cassette, subfamily B/ATP-binding cassette, subfamily C/ATP-binding cassette, subfamily B, multidrug efflux pump [Mitsuaria sp. PDC51]|uniref:ABC transporter ATP-binding protein n=1 Tax=Mitsuaria sp. PDC51 TaxID=1881035 RepID=UPI0008E34F8E|nr:ABC transporter ATP-binding protein [Mitsuaria sp. PDC51]SFR87110.1 ATP-binding cassette, subfamily B/ATP-binding cassette, subfamily C/ATP-binding cassette, subfamily B, multidrug efflux pump [Mitsuaria sp. PDC51]